MSILGNPITLGGGGLELVANVADGATVTATLGSKTVTGVSVGGQARLKIPQEGKWTVSATSGSQVSVPQEVSVPATVDIVLVAPELNDTSWAVIKQTSDANMGANFWSVGDCKEITMNGKVSDGLTLTNYSAWVFIIGFNHNSEREGNGIAFQGFKATKNGTDVCLIDSGYSSRKTSGTWFSMKTSDVNTGGWASCKMRENVMPLIKSSFPIDLQTVVKTSTIYTDNTGGASGNVVPTTTQDDVFLLAEYEIFGRRLYATTEEANYLKQYAYYAAGNSKVKYSYETLHATAKWWARSPRSMYSNAFCIVTDDGTATYGIANSSFGVAPCFKV